MTRLKDIEALLKVEIKQLEELDTSLRIEAKQVIEDFNNKKISAKDAWYSLPPPTIQGVYHPSIIVNALFGPTAWRYPHVDEADIRRLYGGIVNPNGHANSVSQESFDWIAKSEHNRTNNERGKIRKQIVEKIENLRKEHFEIKKREEEEERLRNYSPPSFSIDEYIERKIDERIRARTYREEW
jgi:hypothetical protein